MNKGARAGRHPRRRRATCCALPPVRVSAAAGRARRAARAGARVSRAATKTSTAGHRQARRRGGAWRQRRELRRDRAAAHGAARGAVPGTGAPAGPRDLGHPAGRQEAQRADGAAGPVPRARDRQDLPGAGRGRLAGQQEGARRAAAQVPADGRDGERRVQRGGQGPSGRACAPSRWSRCWRASRCRRALPISLLAVTIKTGRTHQIRVHLASRGPSDRRRRQVRRLRAQPRAAEGRASSACSCMRGACSSPIRASGERIALQADLPPELRAACCADAPASPTIVPSMTDIRPPPFRPDRLRLGRHPVRLHAAHRALHPGRGGRRRRRHADRRAMPPG